MGNKLVGILMLGMVAGCADTNTPLVIRHRAMLAQQKGRVADSIKIREELIAKHPDYYFMEEIYQEQGEAYQLLNQLEKAKESFDAAIQDDPAYALAYANRGEVNLQLGNYEQAIEDCDRAIVLEQDEEESQIELGEVYLVRGNALAELGEIENAMFNWEHAAMLSSNTIAPLMQLAKTSRNFGDYDQALNYLEDALEIEPNNPEIRYLQALTFVALNNNDQAQKSLNVALENDPEKTLQLPTDLNGLIAMSKTHRPAQPVEHIVAKPVVSPETIIADRTVQAKKIAIAFLEKEGIECLDELATIPDAILCRQNDLKFQVLVKITDEKKNHSFDLTAEQYEKAVSQLTPIGIIVVSDIVVDEATSEIKKDSGRVFAFAKNWKPIVSRIKPTRYTYQIPTAP